MQKQLIQNYIAGAYSAPASGRTQENINPATGQSLGQVVVSGVSEIDAAVAAAKDSLNEAQERMQLMLDSTPLACNFWDRNLNNIDCKSAFQFNRYGVQFTASIVIILNTVATVSRAVGT